MKTLNQFVIGAALLLMAPLAPAATYTGSWNNTTFGSSGALTIEFEATAKLVTGSFDFDGPVFGGGDPPAIDFKAKRKPDGSGTFQTLGTGVGDITGSFDAEGNLELIIFNIPGGFLTQARINGKFDLELEDFNATYEIDDDDGLFAQGTAEAHVPKAPVLKIAKKVKVKGKVAKTNLKVTTNTNITSIQASAGKKAKVMVKGSNPYKIIVKNLKGAKATVVVTVTNEDGFTAKKSVKFVKSKSGAAVLQEISGD